MAKNDHQHCDDVSLWIIKQREAKDLPVCSKHYRTKAVQNLLRMKGVTEEYNTDPSIKCAAGGR